MICKYQKAKIITYDRPSGNDIRAEELVGRMNDSNNKPDQITPSHKPGVYIFP